MQKQAADGPLQIKQKRHDEGQRIIRSNMAKNIILNKYKNMPKKQA